MNCKALKNKIYYSYYLTTNIARGQFSLFNNSENRLSVSNLGLHVIF